MAKFFKDGTDNAKSDKGIEKGEVTPSLGNTEEAMEVTKEKKGLGSAKDMAHLLGLTGLQEK